MDFPFLTTYEERWEKYPLGDYREWMILLAVLFLSLFALIVVSNLDKLT